MKTALKITALAVVTVLVALSCAPPEVTLTERDYTDLNESKAAKYTSNAVNSTGISFKSNLRYATGTAAAELTDADKEVYITLPADADVLEQSGTTGLKDFIKFYTYTNDVDKDPPDNDDRPYKPSTLSSKEIDYDVIERQATAWNTSDPENPKMGGTKVTVRFKDFVKEDYIVAKVDAAKFTRYNQPVDKNKDGVSDEYDNEYERLGNKSDNDDPIWSGYTGRSTTGYGNVSDWYKPDLTVTVDIENPGNQSFPRMGGSDGKKAYNTLYIQAVKGNFGPLNGDQTKAIMGDLKDKIQLQEFDTTWSTKIAKAEVYNANVNYSDIPGWWGTSDHDGGFSENSLYFKLDPPKDFGIYRVKADGAATFKKDVTKAGTVKVIIKKSGVSANDNDPKENSKFGSAFIAYKINNDAESSSWGGSKTKIWVNDADTLTGNKKPIVTFDVDMKKVVIEYQLDRFDYYLNTSSPSKQVFVYPTSANKDWFKVIAGSVSLGTGSLDNVIEIPVKDAVVSDDTRFQYYDAITDKYATGKKLSITLADSYSLVGSTDDFTLLINNAGLKYTDDIVSLGNYSNVDSTFYNGTYLWQKYTVSNPSPANGGWQYPFTRIYDGTYISNETLGTNSTQANPGKRYGLYSDSNTYFNIWFNPETDMYGNPKTFMTVKNSDGQPIAPSSSNRYDVSSYDYFYIEVYGIGRYSLQVYR